MRLKTQPGLLLRRDKPAALPFLKWAGGKQYLLPWLRQIVPPFTGRYVEPFLGGGALFFDVAPRWAVLGDTNAELINCYQVVQESVELLIQELATYQADEAKYYEIRALDPDGMHAVARAARTIYLNRTCFNGLYRVNKRGQFNVPYGRYRNPDVVRESRLRAAARRLSGATLVADSYASTVGTHSAAGDFVYLDPPYHPLGNYSDFNRYTTEPFTPADQQNLAQTMAALSAKGCWVMASNSDTELTRSLFDNFQIRSVVAPRRISSNAETRGVVSELLITNY